MDVLGDVRLAYEFSLFMYSMFTVICDYEDTILYHLDYPYADLMWPP